MVAEWLLDGMPSSRLVMLKVALVWPSGIVTVAGTVASLVSLEESATTRSLVGGRAVQTTAVVAAVVPLGTTLLAISTCSDGPSMS